MTAFVNESGQFVDEAGKPFVNGKIFIGANKLDPVLNPITIFSDRELTVVIANPQLLDSFGRPSTKIWIPAKYSIKIEDSTGAQKLHLERTVHPGHHSRGGGDHPLPGRARGFQHP